MKSIKCIFMSLCMLFTIGVSTSQAEILVRLGAPFIDQYACSGEQYCIGAEAIIYKINKAGDIRGEQIRLIPGDSASDPQQTVAVAKKFIDEGVALVVGHWASGASIAASPLLSEYSC